MLKATREHVRNLCVRYEGGDDAGLRSIDIAASQEVKQRRVRREWVDEFLSHDRRQARRVSTTHRLLSDVDDFPIVHPAAAVSREHENTRRV